MNRTRSPSVSESITLSYKNDSYLSDGDDSSPGIPFSQQESTFDFDSLKYKNYTETKTTPSPQGTKTPPQETGTDSQTEPHFVSFRDKIGTPKKFSDSLDNLFLSNKIKVAKFLPPKTPEEPYISFTPLEDVPLSQISQRRLSDPGARTDFVPSNQPTRWDTLLPGQTQFDRAKTLERRSIYCFSLAFFALVSMVPAALFFPPLLSVLLPVVLIGGIGSIVSYTLSGRSKEEFCSQLLDKFSEKIRTHLSESEQKTYPFAENKEAFLWLFKKDEVLFLDFAEKFWDLVAEGRVKDAVDYFESILTVLQEEKETQEKKQELEQRQKQKEFSFSWLRLKEKFTFLLEDPKPDNVKQNEMRALKKAIEGWKRQDPSIL